jgi:hypothetical protein
MVVLPGYSYTNAVDRAREQSAVLVAFSGAGEASMHYVFDRTHTFGGLVLVTPVAAMTDEQVVTTAETWFTTAYRLTDTSFASRPGLSSGALSITHVVHSATSMNLFVWRWPDTQTVGVFLTSRPDLATAFVTAFTAA